jgi:Tol biopolymer transport system component
VTFTWQSLDPEVATVSATGAVTGVVEGIARVRATGGTRSGEASIRVEPVNPVPTVTRLSPASVRAGEPDFTLTVFGTGFRPNIRLRWNGLTRSTTYVSETEARATIPADDIAEAGEARIEIINVSPGGGAAPAVPFVIEPQANPVASITLRQEVAFSMVGGAVPVPVTLRNAAGEILTGRRVKWSSSNQLVATVFGGVVMPVGIGDATITVESEGKTASLALSVGTTISHLLLDDGQSIAVHDMRLGGAPTPFWEAGTGTRFTEPSASPDGRGIAYTIVIGATRSVAVLDMLSRTYTFLSGDGRSDHPAWSPAGDRIAFRSSRDGRADIWVSKPDGTQAVNLTTTMPAGFVAGWPAWSPDGSRLVFSAGLPASVSLYTMRADGTDVRPLLISPEHDSEATWHGNAVVFTRRLPDGSTDLFRIAATGGALIRLTGSGRAHSPAWSPDGRWIAFADGLEIDGRYDIKAVLPFGDEVRMITSTAHNGGGGANPGWLTHQ